jgi:hypothetical protein
VLGLLVVLGVVWYYRQFVQRPSRTAVAEHLVKSVAPLPVRATAEITFGASSARGLNLTYHARFETTEPLYRRVDTLDYLRAHGLRRNRHWPDPARPGDRFKLHRLTAQDPDGMRLEGSLQSLTVAS